MTGRSMFATLTFFATLPASAQLTGKVDDPAWGISFTIPGGWLARKIDSGYLLGSETQPGFLLLTPHQYRSMQELSSESAQGVHDQNGTDLSATGSAVKFGEHGLKVEYAGTLEGVNARAVAIALLSPQGGGVTVLVGVQEESFGPAYHRLAESVAQSVSFKKPSTGPIVEQWRKRLSGSKLTYMSSYTSGMSGGYSSQTVMHLCASGTFALESSSSISVDVPGASGGSAGRDSGRGTWMVLAPAGTPALELRFEDGSVKQYVLSMPQNKLHLNGTRYFQTNDPECP